MEPDSIASCNRTPILTRVERPRVAAGTARFGFVVAGTNSSKDVKSEASGGLPGCEAHTKERPLPLMKPSKDAVELSDKNGNISKYDLDQNGQIVRRFDPLNRLTQTLRDNRGNVIYEEDAAARTKQTLYDLKNNPTQIGLLGVTDP